MCAGRVGGGEVKYEWTACRVFVAPPPPRRGLSGLALTDAVCCTSQWPAKSICFSHASTANTFTLLIKVSAMVTVYRGHCWTLLFLPGIISLFIKYTGIIRNNSLVGRCVRHRFEPQLLNASWSTVHGAWVLWPLGYRGRSITGIMGNLGFFAKSYI